MPAAVTLRLGKIRKRLAHDFVGAAQCLDSRSRAFNRASSTLVVPGRLLASRAARSSQSCSVSGAEPILVATDVIADHCDAWSFVCSSTILTAQSRTAGENRARVDKSPFSHEMEPPGISGRFTVHCAVPAGVDRQRIRCGGTPASRDRLMSHHGVSCARGSGAIAYETREPCYAPTDSRSAAMADLPVGRLAGGLFTAPRCVAGAAISRVCQSRVLKPLAASPSFAGSS